MGKMSKKEALRAIRIGMLQPDQEAEEMHLGQRDAIQERGNDVVPLDVPKRQKMEDVLKEQAKRNQEEIDKTAMETKTEPLVVKEPESKSEDLAQAELNQAIVDFEAKQSQIAEMRAKKTGRFASLAKSLGIKTRNISEDAEVMALEKESHDLYRNLLSKGIHLYKGDKAQLENFLRQFDEFEVFRSVYNQEMDERTKNCKWPEMVLAKFQKFGQKWSEMDWKKKLVISGVAGGLMTAGAIALGAGTFGAAALGAGYRWGFRGFGAMAAGVGRKVQLDARMMKEMEADWDMRFKQKMDFLKQYENNLDQAIEKIISNSAGIKYARKEYEQRGLENTIRARNLALKTFVISSVLGESFRYASQATGVNFGTILKKIGKHTGISIGGIKHSIGDFLSGDTKAVQGLGGGAAAIQAQEALYTRGLDGKITLTQKGVASIGDQPVEGEVKLPPKDLEEIRTRMEAAAKAEAMKKIMQSPAAGAEVNVPEDIQKPSSVPEPAGAKVSDMHVPDAEGKIAGATETPRPKFEEIAVVKIKAGGNMWASIENNIKANPSAYGLDPNSPSFTKDMHRMTQQMLDEFASRKGMSYEQLDQIARTKIRAGDSFKIIHDPTTRDIYIDDFHGKAFGADVSPSGAGAAQEVAPGKAGATVENMKPKTSAAVEDAAKPKSGAAAEHQPAGKRGMELPEEIQAMQDRAQAKWQDAVQAEQKWRAKRPEIAAENAKEMVIANNRLYLSTRGLLDRIVQDAGIGKKAAFWGQPISRFSDLVGTENYIASDVLDQDAVEKMNLSSDKLRELHKILKRYSVHGGETIDECLRKAIMDPKPVGAGRSGASVGAWNLRFINEKILGK